MFSHLERALTDAGEVNGFVGFSPENPIKKGKIYGFLGKSMVSGEDFPNKS
jgi:hypothetical protein